MSDAPAVVNVKATRDPHVMQRVTYDKREDGSDAEHKSETIEKLQSGMINIMADLVESRDQSTGMHIKNTASYVEIIVDKNRDDSDELLYRVILDAENNAIIIGKNGQTLRAISTVLKAAVNATFKKRINVVIDVNHYKEDRYKKVKAIARREAINVAKTHVDCELDPMPNDERKVIHQYLQDFKNVSTVCV